MNNEEVIFIKKQLELNATEKKEILNELQRIKSSQALKRDDEQSKIIRKTDLKNRRELIIEINRPYEAIGRSIAIGLMKVKVDTEKGVLTGVRIIKCLGRYEAEEFTFFMDNYRKTWRAWTRMPKTEQAWR